MFCLSRLYSFKFFKGCLPQIFLGPFLNTLYQLYRRHLGKTVLVSLENNRASLPWNHFNFYFFFSFFFYIKILTYNITQKTKKSQSPSTENKVPGNTKERKKEKKQKQKQKKKELI